MAKIRNVFVIQNSLILILLLEIVCLAHKHQSIEKNNPLNLPALTTSEWKEDFEFFKNKLEKIHPNPFFRVTKTTFYSEFENALKNIGNRSNEENFIRLLQLIQSVQDGHTNVRLMHNSFKVSLLPISTFLFNDGMFIIHARDESLVGSKIVELNGHKIEKVLSQLSTIIPADNEMHVKNLLQREIIMPEILKSFGIGEKVDLIKLKLLYDGKTKEIELKSVSLGEYMTWLSSVEPATNAPISRSKNVYRREDSAKYWKEFLADKKTIYMQYNEIVNRHDIPMREFSKELEKDFEKAEKLIIDLRESPGGNKGTFLSLVRTIKNSKIDKPGKLFLLTGRRTNSAATSLITKLRAETNAITVGEAVGGSPLFYSDVMAVTLPNSKIKVEISTRFNIDSYFRDDRKTHMPDYQIPLKSADHFADRDPTLEYAINYKIKSLPKPSVLPREIIGRYELDSGQLLILENKNRAGNIRSESLFDLILTQVSKNIYKPTNNYDLQIKFDSKTKNLELKVHGIQAFARKLSDGELTAFELIENGEVKKGLEKIKSIARQFPARHVINEADLNRVGYRLLRKGEKEKAIKVFITNTELWSASSNVYDSLGEAYLEDGQLDLAIKNYKKSVAINPNNEGGKNAIKKIEKLLTCRR